MNAQDHVSEDNRIKQLTIALDHITKTYGTLPHLLLGDLNSLTKEDYLKEDWDQISQHRAKSK